MVKILAVGDLHICEKKLQFIREFGARLGRLIDAERPDFVVLLGDVVHRPSRDMGAAAAQLINSIGAKVPTYVLVGNHDMYVKDFFTKDHWLGEFTFDANVRVVDSAVREGPFIFCPFVPTGTFLEALDTVAGGWKDARTIFAHQEFRGGIMRGGPSICGDIWDEGAPKVISGHLHQRQTVGENITYVGSVEDKKPLKIARIESVASGEYSVEYIPLTDTPTHTPSSSDFLTLYRQNILREGDTFVFCAAERALTGEEFDEEDHIFIEIK